MLGKPRKTNFDSPSHTYLFTALNLADAMNMAAHWLRDNDDPVNVSVIVNFYPLPMTAGQVEWEVKVISWAGYDTPAITPEDK